jgi:CIC family chloride channel protein
MVERDGSLLALALLALIAGALAGLVDAIFRLMLAEADGARNPFIAWAHGRAPLGFAFVLAGCATASAVAAGLVRCYSPQAHGSGIPHVEAVLRRELPPAPFLLVP